MLTYLSYRIAVLSLYEDYKITHALEEDHFGIFPEFSQQDGFRVAAGLVSYEGSEQIEDPEIGTLKFYYKHFSHPDYEELFEFKELESEFCERAKDFNDVEGSNPGSGFYPTHPSSVVDLDRLGNLLKCVREPYGIVGNFDTHIAGTLMVTFEKCDRTKRSCKSEAEIEAWMSFKYIFTMENQKKFVSYKLGDETMKINSYGNYYSLSYQQRSDFVRRVKRSYSKWNDSIFGSGSFLGNEDTGFVIDELPQRILPYP